VERLDTGIPGLDSILHGGLPQGALFFVGGPPGSGKTLLSEQIAFRQAAKGGTCLIVTALSEPHEKLMRHAEQFPWFDWARVGREIEFLSLYQTVLEQGLSGALDLLVRTVHERGATMLMFDGFRGLRDFGGDELTVRKFIFELGGKLGLLVQDQETCSEMDRWGSRGQAKTAQTRSANSWALSSRSGSTTLRLPWTHLGSLGFSQGLLTGRY
jgi:circadian clock protein KaiC